MALPQEEEVNTVLTAPGRMPGNSTLDISTFTTTTIANPALTSVLLIGPITTIRAAIRQQVSEAMQQETVPDTATPGSASLRLFYDNLLY